LTDHGCETLCGGMAGSDHSSLPKPGQESGSFLKKRTKKLLLSVDIRRA
jgi:hypothetical protein